MPYLEKHCPLNKKERAECLCIKHKLCVQACFDIAYNSV